MELWEDRAEMAVRLGIAFDTTADSWLNQQALYDLWKIGKTRKALEKQVRTHAA